MAISKSKREEVYQKYNGHCAYCGREIAYKDMQVDHFLPLRAWGIEDTCLLYTSSGATYPRWQRSFVSA